MGHTLNGLNQDKTWIQSVKQFSTMAVSKVDMKEWQNLEKSMQQSGRLQWWNSQTVWWLYLSEESLDTHGYKVKDQNNDIAMLCS